VRIVTWNVNSMKSRLPRFISWVQIRQPDVVLLQETKSTDEQWPTDVLAGLGYESAHLGTGRWNGVAVLSRVGLEHLSYGLTGQPTFEGVTEPRALGATCAGIRLWSLYVPNGRALDHPHYQYKLDFLAAVGAQARTELASAKQGYGLLGDFNVAPRDDDVWDITAFEGKTHVSRAERDAVHDLLGADPDDMLTDVTPRASADKADARPAYTFWEMRQLGFQKGRGMRIDLALLNGALRSRLTDVWVDRDTRKGQGPSDHAPLVIDLD
jgi:exodeoxyribonuclease-3